MIGLKVAVVTMEKMVHNEKLGKLSLAEQQAYATEPEDEIGKATVQDCVDQTSNGISYLYVLAQKAMMRHHSIIEPGADGTHHWTSENKRSAEFLHLISTIEAPLACRQT